MVIRYEEGSEQPLKEQCEGVIEIRFMRCEQLQEMIKVFET